MSEKEGLLPQGAPPSYQQSQGYGPTPGGTPGVPSYAAVGQQGYSTPYGQQQVIVHQPGVYRGHVTEVPDNMGLAILATVLCCWPLGIVAIFRAQEARRALDRGDVPSALMLSAQAKRYSLWAVACGCVLVVVVIVIVVVVVTSNSYYG
ncbi:proline-rich transmembrane protein 1-like [Haliotis rubra]|uniref:proline-rich transmembrane protein 1-like n=1 Tax=Haliotis rubra TaxID=36100 RepID=UPI001EE57AA9|nr:proline-rich transmembrane protein 1-like [Haliotis rubra]